jgi:uncharacterized protein
MDVGCELFHLPPELIVLGSMSRETWVPGGFQKVLLRREMVRSAPNQLVQCRNHHPAAHSFHNALVEFIDQTEQAPVLRINFRIPDRVLLFPLNESHCTTYRTPARRLEENIEMRIGVLSDIHDHLHNLQPALTALAGETEMLICCGDLCSPFVMDELKRYPGPVHVIFGNNDADLFRITRKSDARVQVHGEFLELEISGFRIAANHFDNIAAPIARSGEYDLVCFGHNHRYSLQHFGRTTALNPGAIMGVAFSSLGSERTASTYAVVDTATAAVALFRVEGHECYPHVF